MSFHLTLVPAGGALDAEAFEALFARRWHYQVEDGQAAYQNRDTGVYFLFDHEDGAVHFSINTRRSAIFAEEAAEELEAVFGTGFVDGNGEPFSAEAFREAWRAANVEAVAALLAEGAEPLTLPARTNLAMWRWNRKLMHSQAEIGPAMAAPPLVFFAGPDGNPRPTYVWLVTMPMAKPPPAEAVLIADEVTPRLRDRLLGQTPQPDTVGVLEIRRLRDLGFPAWRAGEHLVFHIPRGQRHPGMLATLAAAESYAKPVGAAIPIDQVLDRETVDAARAA
jgi:hypothetical protein